MFRCMLDAVRLGVWCHCLAISAVSWGTDHVHRRLFAYSWKASALLQHRNIFSFQNRFSSCRSGRTHFGKLLTVGVSGIRRFAVTVACRHTSLVSNKYSKLYNKFFISSAIRPGSYTENKNEYQVTLGRCNLQSTVLKSIKPPSVSIGATGLGW